jgi:hypothetical protein
MKKLLLALLLIVTAVSGANADIRDFRTVSKSTGGTATRSPQDKGSDILSFKDFKAKCDGTTDDTAALTDAINWLNGARFRGITQIGGNCKITSPLPAILQSDIAITGRGAMITQSGTNGNIFTIGSDSVNVGRVQIKGFSFFWNGTVSPDDFLLDVVQAGDSAFTDFVLTSCPSMFRLGGTTTADTATRILIDNWIGNCNKGGAADANGLIRNGTSGRIHNVHMNGPGGGNSGTKAVFKFAPGAGQALDTWWITECGEQFFTTSAPPASSDGKAYGVLLDRTFGSITNIKVLNNGLDHNTTAGIGMIDAGTGSDAIPFDRNIVFAYNRIATDSGRGVDVALASAPAGLIVRAMDISHNYIGISDNSPAISVVGRTYISNLVISNNRIGDLLAGTTKDKAISVDVLSATITGNSVGPDQAATGWQTIVKVENAANDNLVINNNNGNGLVPGYVTEPAYTTVNGNRQISGGKIEQWITPTADATNSTVTMADITGMTATLEANSVYMCDGVIDFETDTVTTGVAFTIDSTLSDTVRWAHRFSIPTNQSGSATPIFVLGRAPGAGNLTSPSVDTANATMMAAVNASIVTGPTAGTATVRFRSEVAASVATVRKLGSMLHCRKKVG